MSTLPIVIMLFGVVAELSIIVIVLARIARAIERKLNGQHTKALEVLNLFATKTLRTDSRDICDWKEDMAFVQKFASEQAAALREPVAETPGWRLVPEQPTYAMLRTVRNCDPLGVDIEDKDLESVYGNIWKGVLIAAHNIHQPSEKK